MKKICTTLFALFTLVLIKAQNSPDIILPTWDNECGGSIAIHSLMPGTSWILHPINYDVFTSQGSNMDYTETDSTLVNLCGGNYVINYTNTNGVVITDTIHLSIDYTGSTSCDGSFVEFNLESYTNVSSPDSCDATLTISIAGPVTQISSNCPFPINPGGTYANGYVYYTWDNLCSMEYQISATDFGGCTKYFQFNPRIDSFNTAGILNIHAPFEFSIFPNPVIDVITIQQNNFNSYEIIISDITGKEILREMSNSKLKNLDLSTLSEGNYIVSLKNENSIINKRITK